MSTRSPARRPVDAGTPRWLRGPLEPQLERTEVHVWRVDLAALGDAVSESLSEVEHERAARIAERERRLWRASRGLLRTLLGRYLREDPSAIELVAGPHGKPGLAGAGGGSHRGPALDFNLSHSRELALYAFSRAGSVGVDVQLARDAGTREVADHVALARRAFGSEQARRLGQLEPGAREREFLRLWTRHEAELKRRGSGLGGRPVAAAGRKADGAPGKASWILELDVGIGAAAAIALERRASELRRWAWT